ncbi:MAG TPA: sigma-70 family RNA polymerase sigma factor [Gemmataceae bacterium]|nr:sigma-70 family RNA polymerase sigma factor [Gemmataceae bacterium]
MSAEPLDGLLERLSEGDPAAAEQVLADYAPYLRLVVRRRLSGRLRAKFDSLDVLQSVWVHVLRGLRGAGWHFRDRPQLLAFLVTVARRRLTSRFRHHRAALRREQPGAADLDGLPAPRQTQPAEAARAEELWEQMLALCPPAHHELLRLKRQGLTLAEVAARTGMHEGSVRRVLRRLARRLALEQGPPAPQLLEAPA